MNQDRDLYIYCSYTLCWMGIPNFEHILVYNSHMDFLYNRVSKCKIQRHFSACKSHLFHKEMVYKGRYSLVGVISLQKRFICVWIVSVTFKFCFSIGLETLSVLNATTMLFISVAYISCFALGLRVGVGGVFY